MKREKPVPPHTCRINPPLSAGAHHKDSFVPECGADTALPWGLKKVKMKIPTVKKEGTSCAVHLCRTSPSRWHSSEIKTLKKC